MNQYGQAELTKTVDMGYKAGYVQCECGWRKELGDGFNGYHIDACPNCNPKIATTYATKVIKGKPGNYTIQHGDFVYFVIANCIHVQYSGVVWHKEYRQRIPR